MKRYIIAIIVVMVAIGGIFVFKDKYEEAIIETDIEQVYGPISVHEMFKREMMRQEGVVDVDYYVSETGTSVYWITYEGGSSSRTYYTKDMEIMVVI